MYSQNMENKLLKHEGLHQVSELQMDAEHSVGCLSLAVTPVVLSHRSPDKLKIWRPKVKDQLLCSL